MARDSAGTYSLPAGNPVVSGETISSTVHNNTMADIAAELTDSLSRSGKGGMSAPLELVDGTEAAPGLSFNNEVSSGLYRAATDDLRFSSTNQDVFRWTDARVGAVGVPLAIWDSTVSSLLAEIEHDDTDLRVRSLDHGAPVYLTGEDTGGTERLIAGGDPDGAASLYYTGAAAVSTTNTGINVFTQAGAGGNAQITLTDGDNEIAAIYKSGNGEMLIRNQEHGGGIRLQGEDESGTVVNLLVADPDGTCNLYHDGKAVLTTNAAGVIFYDTNGDDPLAQWFQDDGSTRNGYIEFDATDGLIIEQEVHGLPVTIRSENTSGTNRNILVGNPDGATELYHAGTKTIETTSSGAIITGGVVIASGTNGASFRAVEPDGGAWFGVTSTGAMAINQTESDGDFEKVWITGDRDGAVNLRYNNNVEFRTADSDATDYLSGAEVKDYGGTFRQVGFLDMEPLELASSRNVANDDWGKAVFNRTTEKTLTLVNATTVPNGALMTVVAVDSILNIADGSVTLRWLDGSTSGGSTGDRKLAPGGIATIWKTTDTNYYIWGVGIS